MTSSSVQKSAPASPKHQSSTPWATYLQAFLQLARLHIALPILLVFWPCAWSLTAVAIKTNLNYVDYTIELFRFLGWATLVRGASCAWNDIADRKLDAKVERTKNRPLAAGKVSVSAAMAFAWAQAFSTLLLMWTTNNRTLILNVASGIILTGPYPYMKRLTNWPQAFLGIAINCGMVIAWSAVEYPNMKLMSSLYFAAWSWTVYYDTCYAMMDRKDDIKAGNKSTAILFGDGRRGRFILSLFAAGTIVGLIAFGIHSQQATPYYILSVLGTAIHLWWQIANVDFNNIKSCLKLFQRNATQVGGIIWSGLFVNYLMTIPEVQAKIGSLASSPFL